MQGVSCSLLVQTCTLQWDAPHLLEERKPPTPTCVCTDLGDKTITADVKEQSHSPVKHVAILNGVSVVFLR